MAVRNWRCLFIEVMRKFGHTPVSIMPRFVQFRDAMLGLDGPGNSYNQSMTVPQQKTDYKMK